MLKAYRNKIASHPKARAVYARLCGVCGVFLVCERARVLGGNQGRGRPNQQAAGMRQPTPQPSVWAAHRTYPPTRRKHLPHPQVKAYYEKAENDDDVRRAYKPDA